MTTPCYPSGCAAASHVCRLPLRPMFAEARGPQTTSSSVGNAWKLNLINGNGNGNVNSNGNNTMRLRLVRARQWSAAW